MLRPLIILFILLFSQYISFAQVNCDTIVLVSKDTILVMDIVNEGDQIICSECNKENEEHYIFKKENILSIRKSSQIKDIRKNRLIRDSIKLDIYTYNDGILDDVSIEQFKDSSISVFQIGMPNRDLSINNIKNIKIYEKNKLAKNTMLGIGIGATFGFVVGTILKNDSSSNAIIQFSDNESRNFLTLTGMTLGGLIGLMSGTINVNLSIKGDKDRIERMKKRFEY